MNLFQILQAKLNVVRLFDRALLLVKEESGTTLVEFAFSSIFLFGITFGMVDFSSIIYTRNAVQSAAQEGAREAIMIEDDGSLRYDDIREAVKDKLILLDPGKADITISMVEADTVEVSVEYPVQFYTPVGELLTFAHDNEWTINAVARMVIH